MKVVLFIARKFPPQKGGMERVAYELSKHLSKIADVKLLKWGGANRWLPLILPCFFLRALWLLSSGKIHVIYLQDGLLAPLGLMLKTLTGKPVAITIHGLDITYRNRLYQSVVPRCVGLLDKVICISNATREECLSRGIPESKIAIIANGVSAELHLDMPRAQIREALFEQLGLDLSNKTVLLSVGRLVERKGVHWFVEEVLPQIHTENEDWAYVIVGEGKQRSRIEEAITRSGIAGRVLLLGTVSDQVLKYLYNSADILVMPNLAVEGDLEGFGVVVLEASSCGLPVVASNLEGIRDAVTDNENGFLVESRDARGFVEAIEMLLEDGQKREEFGARARKFTLENYGWDKIARLYLEEFRT